jgi:hypothetical protein
MLHSGLTHIEMCRDVEPETMLITENSLQAAKFGTIAVHVPGCPGLQGDGTVATGAM